METHLSDNEVLRAQSPIHLKEMLYATLYCLATTLLFLRGPLFFPRVYHIPYDLEDFHHPLSQFIALSLREFGRLPWWNPYSYMGEPFFGNVQAAMFYPPTLLTVLAGNLTMGGVSLRLVEFQLAMHVAVAGIGAYLLLRLLGSGIWPALAGATIYHLGAFFASQTQHLGAVSGAAWLPWFVAALYRLERRRDWRSAALAGLALALMIMPGFPAVWLPVLVFGPLLYAFWMWQRHPKLEWPLHSRGVLLFAVAVLLAVLLAAVSWVPGYEVGRRSVAALRPAVQALEGLGLESLTSLFWPNLFNQLHGEYWLAPNPTFVHLYQGVPALLLVFAGLRWLAGRRDSLPFLLAAAVAALWMFGTVFFLSQFFYLLFPGFISRGFYPGFLLAYFSLFFAVLAAMALAGWEHGERERLFDARFCRRAALIAGGVALLVSLAGVFAAAGSPAAGRAAAAGGTLLLVAAIVAICGLLAGAAGSIATAGRPRFSAVLCAVIFLDLLATGSNSRLNTLWEEGADEPPAVSFLRERLGPNPLYRIDTTEAGYRWQTATPAWQLLSANGMNPLLLRETVAYRAVYSHPDDRQFVLDAPDSPLLDLAGVRYIVSTREKISGAQLIYRGDLEIKVFENPRAFPRYFLVGAVAGAVNIESAARLIHKREVDPSRVALVPNSDLRYFTGLTGPATSDELGKVELLAYSPNEIRLRVNASRPAVLVATETYWPDWQATLDGASVPLVRADGVFRAVQIPAGIHEVRMFIVPRPLYLGAALSLLGLLLAAGCLFRPARTGAGERGLGAGA